MLLNLVCAVPGVQELAAAPQCLFLRLFQRRGPCFRLASLAYAEVGDVAAAASDLQAAGMAELLAADNWLDILQASWPSWLPLMES